jgi:IclR family transcriptional regulator, acetate operon repressor
MASRGPGRLPASTLQPRSGFREAIGVTDETARSATNVLRLVLMLGEKGKLRVTGVAGALQVAPSTAHRLLAALASCGFAVQAEDRTYVPGPAYVRLRMPADRPEALVALVGPYLAQLSAATGETTHLMVLDGKSVRFIHSVEGTAALRVASRIGAVIPAHLTSGGKALLAQMTDEQVPGSLVVVPRGCQSRI